MNTPPATRSRREAIGRHQEAAALTARADACMLTEAESFSPVPGTEWDGEGGEVRDPAARGITS